MENKVIEEFKIMEVKDLVHSTFGDCLLVEANPIEKGIDSAGFSYERLYEHIYEKTHKFVYPKTQSNISFLTGIANSESLLDINFNDFKKEYSNFKSKSTLFYIHKSFYFSSKIIRRINVEDSTERKVGIISYEDKSRYYGAIKNSKRDGYGFMMDESNQSLTLAKFDNDDIVDNYHDLLEEMINNTVKFVGNSFYGNYGVFIGDLICPDMNDSIIDERRKKQLGLSGKNRYGIAILDNGCMYVGSFIAGYSMKLVNGCKIDTNGERQYGEFNIPINSDGGEYPWIVKKLDFTNAITLDFANAVTVEQFMALNGLKAGELGIISSNKDTFFCKRNADGSPVIGSDDKIVSLAECNSKIDANKPVMFAKSSDGIWVGYNPAVLDFDAIW